jgi:hypothetical protein
MLVANISRRQGGPFAYIRRILAFPVYVTAMALILIGEFLSYIASKIAGDE